MNEARAQSLEQPTTLYVSDLHVGASTGTDDLIKRAFDLFPEFKRRNGFNVQDSELLGDLIECWLPGNEPQNDYSTYGRVDVMSTFRQIFRGIFDGERTKNVLACIGNHDLMILPEDTTAKETKREQERATKNLRKFLGVVVKNENIKTQLFEGMKVTDDGVIRHHGDLFDIRGLVNKVIDEHPEQLLDWINGGVETQFYLHKNWREVNQRYIWPALKYHSLAMSAFSTYDHLMRRFFAIKEGDHAQRSFDERLKNPVTPWALTQFRMMDAINGGIIGKHVSPLMVSGHTHVPLIAKHPHYRGTVVSLGGWDGEINHPVVGLRKAGRFFMAEFNPVQGWGIRDDVKIA